MRISGTEFYTEEVLKMILLSVIVPIYNTQDRLLERCLTSLTRIGIDDYEVILVDDGSDAYIERICVEYTKNCAKFRYIKKANGGVSSARNCGIEKALGRYLTFVDSDDVVIADSITKTDFSSQADLIFFNKTLYKGEMQKVRKEIEGQSRYIPTQDIFGIMVSLNRFHGPMARLYKSSILRETGICFDTDMMQGEDVIFNIDFLKKCKTVYYIDKSVYGYYMTPVTLRNRWKKEPKRMISNFQYLYLRKINLLNDFDDTETKKILSYKLNSNTEYLLFQSCLDMIQACVFSDDIYEKCIKISKIISSQSKLDKKAKIAAFLIEHKLWVCLTFIGIIREIYLSKIKKTWK